MKWISLWFFGISLMHNPIIAPLHGSHDLSARRAWRMLSSNFVTWCEIASHNFFDRQTNRQTMSAASGTIIMYGPPTCILEATFTVSPKRQYLRFLCWTHIWIVSYCTKTQLWKDNRSNRGILLPTTPAVVAPVCIWGGEVKSIDKAINTQLKNSRQWVPQFISEFLTQIAWNVLKV